MTTTSTNLPTLHTIFPTIGKKCGGSSPTGTIDIIAELGKKTYLLQELISLGSKDSFSLFYLNNSLPNRFIDSVLQRLSYTTYSIKGRGKWLVKRSDLKSLANKLELKDLKVLDVNSSSIRKAAAKSIQATKLSLYEPRLEYNMKLSTSWTTLPGYIRIGKRFVNDGQNRLVVALKGKHLEFSCPTCPSTVYPVVQAYFKSIGDKAQYSEITKLVQCMQAHRAYTEAGIHRVYINESTVKNNVTSDPKKKTVNVTVSDGNICNNEIKIPK